MEIIRGKQRKALKVVMYGVEGVGKSTFAANFPDPVFIDTEGSTAALDVARTKKPTSWTELINQVKELKQSGEFKTIVIDTMDWAEALCFKHICDKHRVDGIEGIGYGKGYVYAVEEFAKLLNVLTTCTEEGINIALLAHATIKKFEQPDEMGAYDIYTLKLVKQNAALLKEWADMLLFARYDTYTVRDTTTNKIKAQGNQRVMQTEHGATWDAKNRYGLEAKLPLDFTKIAHLFSVPKAEAPRAEKPAERKEPVQAASDGVTDRASTKYEGLPAEVVDLMKAHDLTPEELHNLCVHKGYVTADTPFKNYPENLTKNISEKWNSLYRQAKELALPFEI